MVKNLQSLEAVRLLHQKNLGGCLRACKRCIVPEDRGGKVRSSCPCLSVCRVVCAGLGTLAIPQAYGRGLWLGEDVGAGTGAGWLRFGKSAQLPKGRLLALFKFHT